jgi:hypothetical protein
MQASSLGTVSKHFSGLFSFCSFTHAPKNKTRKKIGKLNFIKRGFITTNVGKKPNYTKNYPLSAYGSCPCGLLFGSGICNPYGFAFGFGFHVV